MPPTRESNRLSPSVNHSPESPSGTKVVFSAEEATLISKVMSQISVSASDPNAGVIVSLTQSIMKKLTDASAPTG